MKPYYDKDGIQIFLGDCLEIMPQFPDKRFDLILTDPPYNISKKNNFATMERYNQYKGMDFGEWDKNFDQIAWLKDCARIMKEPSCFLGFNSWQNLKEISDELEKHSVLIKRILVLRKTNPMPVNRDRLFVNSFEFILFGTKGKKWTFNRRFENFETGYFECKNNGETPHPTEKQVKTFEEFITILSRKSDLILDPFMGSGTTLVAAQRLGRKAVGIEISEKYCEIAAKRIDNEVRQGKLF